MYRALFIIILCSGLLAACGGPEYVALPEKVSSQDSPVVARLYQHYNEWRGVRYREGGLSKKGVDCSGFVYLAYKKAFHKRIPRSTELQADAGKSVDSSQLRPGDLVFFKTGFKVRHVGIYVEQGKFMHASSSRGVMMSRLDNPYWTDAYWMSRRM